MALASTITFEVRTTGADTNGGGFKTGASGTNHTLQDAAQYSVTDAVTAGTTTITSASANFGTDVVGNVLYIQGGTGSITAGWYEITARTNSTTITVDRSTGLTTGTGATLKIGGALLTIGTAESIMVAGNVTWVKSGTYTTTATITFNCGNSLPNGTPSYILGYDATRGDNPTGTGRPLISTSSALNPMVVVSTGPRIFANFRLDGTDTAVHGIVIGDGANLRGACVSNCKVERTTTTGIRISTGDGGMAPIVGCEVTDLKAGATIGIEGGCCVACYVHDSPGVGFSYPLAAINCIADTMGSDGFRFGSLGTGTLLFGNVSYDNTGDGFDASDTYSYIGATFNNIAYENGGYGMRIDKTEVVARPFLVNYNAFGANFSGARQNFIAGDNDVTLTADPFTDAVNADFSLNNTAGGGAALRAVGYPGTMP